MPLIGLLSSWATVAESLPSEAIFSMWSTCRWARPSSSVFSTTFSSSFCDHSVTSRRAALRSPAIWLKASASRANSWRPRTSMRVSRSPSAIRRVPS